MGLSEAGRVFRAVNLCAASAPRPRWAQRPGGRRLVCLLLSLPGASWDAGWCVSFRLFLEPRSQGVSEPHVLVLLPRVRDWFRHRDCLPWMGPGLDGVCWVNGGVSVFQTETRMADRHGWSAGGSGRQSVPRAPGQLAVEGDSGDSSFSSNRGSLGNISGSLPLADGNRVC